MRPYLLQHLYLWLPSVYFQFHLQTWALFNCFYLALKLCEALLVLFFLKKLRRGKHRHRHVPCVYLPNSKRSMPLAFGFSLWELHTKRRKRCTIQKQSHMNTVWLCNGFCRPLDQLYTKGVSAPIQRNNLKSSYRSRLYQNHLIVFMIFFLENGSNTPHFSW